MTLAEFLKAYSAYVILFLGFIYGILKDKFSAQRKIEKAQSKGIQALLRERLLRDYKRYVAQGWVSLDEKSNYENMYVAYHNLGKNGVMTKCYETVNELPTEEPKN